MALLLKVIKGVLEGQSFQVEHGLTIGRATANIALREAKISTLHAKVKKSTTGDFYIIDNASTNGTFVDGKKIKHIKLAHGQKIAICNSILEVIDTAKPQVVKSAEPKPKPLSAAVPAPKVVPPPTASQIIPPVAAPTPTALPPEEKRPEPETWRTYLTTALEKLRAKVKDRQRVVAPLSPALTLTFQTGVQADTVWTLGYGPRKAGAKSLDLPIHEPDAPGLCFEIVPTPSGTLFKTVHPQKVLLNDQSVSSETLKIGDVIKIKNTEIEIGLIE